jgi:hypothetical protein
MLTPTVTEIPRTLSAVGRDTFIDGADPVPHSRPRSRPAARTLRVAQAPSMGHLPRAAGPAASAMTFPRAA